MPKSSASMTQPEEVELIRPVWTIVALGRSLVRNGTNGKVMNVAGRFHSIGLRLGTTSVFSCLGESKVKMAEITVSKGWGS